MPDYKVNKGIDYPPDKRAEEGDVVSDIPSKSVKWLLESGVIEVANGNRNKKNKVDLVINDDPVVEEATIVDDAPVVETVEREDAE